MRNITMPKMGLNMEEGTVVSWQISKGDSFKKGDQLCVIESDKSIIDYSAEFSGRIINIIIEADQAVSVGSVIAVADETY
ncbi:MAG: hypothetical protein HQ557_07180 [Bacteroidetes bacterium]|nr:hypothetical protein [Bacteroidota bacterium]